MHNMRNSKVCVALGGVMVLTATCGSVRTSSVDDASSIDALSPVCGNSRIDPGEDCDSGGVATADCAFDCKRPPWQKVATLNSLVLDPDSSGYTAVGFGTKIFFGPETNNAANSYWRSVDVLTGTVSAPLSLPAPPNDFCACDLPEVLVATPTSIYMFGNHGAVYSPSAGTWGDVPAYNANFHRGDSAGAYEGNNNSIFMVAGRTSTNAVVNTAVRYVLNDNAFIDEGGVLPFGLEHAVAYAPPGDNRTYVAGGVANDGSLRHLMVHATGSGAWNALPDAPADLGRGVSGMGLLAPAGGTKRLFVSTDSFVYLFNIAANVWDRQVPLPGNTSARTVTVSGVPYAMLQAGGNVEVYKLLPIP